MNPDAESPTENGEATPRDSSRPRIAAIISAGYALVAFSWILCSDRVLGILVRDPEKLIFLSSCKGLFFVAVTSGILYWTLSRVFGAARRMEHSLRESEARFRGFLEHLPDAVVIASEETIIYVNQAALRMFGVEAEQALVGRAVYDVMHPDEVQGAREYWQKIRSGGDIPREQKRQFRRRDGSNFYGQVSRAICQYGGKPALQVVIRDITHQLATERKIEDLNRIHAMLSSTSQAIVRIQDRQTLFREACRIAVENGKFVMAFVGVIDEKTGDISIAAATNTTPENLARFNLSIRENEVGGQGPCGRAGRENRPVVSNDFELDPHMAPWREGARKRGVRAQAALPLRAGNRVVAVLNLLAANANAFIPEEMELLGQLAEDLSFGLEFLEQEAGRARAEAALRRSEQWFRSLIENAADLTTVLAPDGVIQFQSASVKEVTGYQAEDWVGRPFLEFVHSQDTERVREKIAAAMKQDGRVVLEDFRVQHGNGTWRHLNGVAHNLLSEEGVRGVVINCRDVSERKSAEEALRAGELRLNLALDAAEMGLWEYDFATRRSWRSVKHDQIFGLDSTVTEWDWDILLQHVVPEERDYVRRRLEEGLLTGRIQLECRVQYPDGTGCWVALSAQIAFGADGLPARALGTVMDISRRKRMESALQLTQFVVDSSPDAILWVGRDGAFSYINDAACALLQYTREQLLEVKLPAIDAGANGADWPKVWAGLKNKGAAAYETIFHDRAGETIPMEVTVNPLEFAGSEYLCVIARNIRERKRVEQELRTNQERLRHAQRVGRIGSWEYNVQTRRFWGSEEALSIFGLPREKSDLEVEEVEALIPERQRVRQAMLDLIEKGQPYCVEYAVTPPGSDGRLRMVSSVAEVEKDQAGIPVRVVGVIQDITQRRQVEDQLRLQSSALESAGNAIVITNRYGNITWVNRAFCRLTGYEPAEVAGKTPNLFKSGAHDAAFYAKLWETVLSGMEWRGEITNRRKDGTLYTEEMTITPVRDHDGQITHFIAIKQDVTEQRKAEEQIRAQARLLDLANDAIAVADLEGRIHYWNRSAELLYGWTAEELRGRQARKFFLRDETLIKAAEKAVIDQGEWYGEMRHETKSGKEVMVSSSWTLVRDTREQPQAILMINADITEKKQLETRFLRSQRLESIGTLAGGIAHDLNNILAPILMSANLLRGEHSKETVAHVADMIETNAKRGSEIVSQVLTFARGVGGARVPVDPRNLVRDLLSMAQETFPKSISIESSIARDAWPITGDVTQLHQVLLNLLVNARDAMPNGGKLKISVENVTLDAETAAVQPDVRPGTFCNIRVIDNGTGIPPAIMEKIFDPFFTTKEAGKGTGLGLSTVLGIVKSHNGFLQVQSQVGQGTYFSIFLPATPAAKASTQAAPQPLPRGAGQLVLVVDDEIPVRNAVKKVLEVNGYRVVAAGNGQQALEIFQQHGNEIQLVLTDMMMPVMDGVTLARKLKESNSNLKVIASSGLYGQEERTKLEAIGVAGFLPKPSSSQELLLTVGRVLNG